MSDIENVVAALNLEYGAVKRYAYQIEGSPFPALNTMLEGVRRTEGEHVETLFAYLKAQQADTPEVGRGFATVLTHLKLNVAFERAALDAYNQFAGASEDPALKSAFRHLAHSEAGHINLFKRLIELIEANNYPVAVYCPVCGWEIDFGLNPSEGAVLKCAMCKRPIKLKVIEGDYTAVEEG